MTFECLERERMMKEAEAKATIAPGIIEWSMFLKQQRGDTEQGDLASKHMPNKAGAPNDNSVPGHLDVRHIGCSRRNRYV